jgi:hypothetical protein
MKFNSYNSTASLASYTEGDTYAFYVRNNLPSHWIAADSEASRKYAPALAHLVRNYRACNQADGRWQGFTRVFGVVVGKHAATKLEPFNTITMMFQTVDGRYLLTNLMVEGHDVYTNGKDLVDPAAYIPMNFSI